MQDLFIFPQCADRTYGVPARGDRYATTIRTYDRTLRAWRLTFINPAAPETSAQLIARRKGEGIEMEGKLSDGTPIRWRYVTIEPASFHWSDTADVPVERLALPVLDSKSRPRREGVV